MTGSADAMFADDTRDPSPDPAPLSPDLRRLVAYWRSRSGPRRWPARADIDPLDLGYLIGRLALVEVRDDRPRYFVRVWSGAHVVCYGVDLTGKCLDVARPDGGCVPTAELDRCIETGAPVLGVCAVDRDGQIRRWESLVLPLGEKGRPGMLLVGLVSLA